MAQCVKFVLLTALCALPYMGISAIAGPDFSHHAVLDRDGQYQLYWKFDEETVTFQLHATTKGWAAVGFSPNGGMGGADIALFWVDGSGKGHVSDRHAKMNGYPPEDEKQDYMLMDSSKNATHLIVTFSRKRNTCDANDFVLTDDTVRIIYASHDEVPDRKNSFKKHSVRGSKSLRLFDVQSGDVQMPDQKDARPLDIRVSQVHVPENESTTYWCEVLALPKITQKVHIIRTEPIIEEQNIDVVHHIVVYGCSKDMKDLVGKGRPCFDSEGEEAAGTNFYQCRQQVMAVWAVGGQGTTYPEDIGYPLYNEGKDMYVLMEMHYDNAQFKKDKIDSSGMRVWITEKLRPVDAGQGIIGLPVHTEEQMIPPGVTEFTNYAYCSAECTEGLPEDGVKVLGGLLHTHLAGRKVRVAHIRNGKQLPPVLSDEHYDFNYQGDELVVECVYETMDRTKTTFSGHGTHDEMCVVFLHYYPAKAPSRGFACMSTPDKPSLYKTLGIDVVAYNETDPSDRESGVILPNGQKKKLGQYLKQDFKYDWTPGSVEKFQQALRKVNHTVMCGMAKKNQSKLDGSSKVNTTTKAPGFIQQPGYPKITEPLVIPDTCNKNPAANSKDREENETKRHRPANQPREQGSNAGSGGHPNQLLWSIFMAVIGVMVFQ